MSKGKIVLILAAGYGTRLKPLTLSKPKCLVEVGNKPILLHWLKIINSLEFSDVIINTHYLHKQVSEFISTQNNSGLNIIEVYEENLLGTAGTIMKNYELLKNKDVLMIHADNYTTCDLGDLVKSYRNMPKNCLLTMLTFNSKTPHKCGVVKINKKNIVTEFHEKVNKPPSNIANGAVYLFNQNLLNWIIRNEPNAKDFSLDIIPKLINKIYTWHHKEPFIDIGTLKSLKEANEIHKKVSID